MMKLVLIILVLALVLALLNGESLESELDATTPTHAADGDKLTLEQLAKLPIKKLRVMLTKKGLQCKGCSEKSEFVAKAHESQDLPDVVAPAETEAKTPPTPPAYEELRAGQPPPPGVSQEKMDELMAKLKMGGFGNSKMFSADDLKNMSPEDLSANLGGKSKKKSRSGSGKGKSKNTRSKSSEKMPSEPTRKVEIDEDLDGSHTIEL